MKGFHHKHGLALLKDENELVVHERFFVEPDPYWTNPYPRAPYVARCQALPWVETHGWDKRARENLEIAANAALAIALQRDELLSVFRAPWKMDDFPAEVWMQRLRTLRERLGSQLMRIHVKR